MYNRIPKANMLTRYLYGDGVTGQQERMIRDKRKTLSRALLYSYQAALVKKLYDDKDTIERRALINPDKTKQDYDEKVISIGFESNFKTGDIFQWLGTNTYWLIYLQDLTELAYFRGNIRRCSYEIAWEDENKNYHKTYVALRGPVETKINYIQKHEISIDTPNHSLDILLPYNDDNIKLCQRYNKFYLQNDPNKTCWRIEATDLYSTPGIIEINAVEYYSNETADDIDNGIVNGLIQPIQDPNENKENGIIGDTFIKPKVVYEYKYDGIQSGKWTWDKKLPLTVKVNEETNTLKLRWETTYCGQFDLFYGPECKTIVVESLF